MANTLIRKIKIWRSRDGWRWHLKASNGRIIAESGEAYKRLDHCKDAVLNFTSIIRNGLYEVEVQEMTNGAYEIQTSI